MENRKTKKGELIDFVSKRLGTAEPQSSKSVTITGNNNIAGNNNTVVNTESYTVKPNVILDPDDARYISDKQCALLKSLIEEIVKLEAICKKNPVSYGAAYSILFNKLSVNKKRPEITKYRLIPVHLFENAEKYLRQWIGRLNSSKTAIKNNPNWRNSKYSYIKLNEKKFGLQEKLATYLKKNHSVSSIKDLDDKALQLTCSAMSRWIKTLGSNLA